MTSGNNIYVMQAGSGPVKIGSSRAPQRRLLEVHYFHRNGFDGEIFLRHSIPVPEDLKPRKVERLAHLLASDARLQGEWFDLSPESAVEVIRRAIALRGVYPKMLPIGLHLSPELKESIGVFWHSEQISSQAEAIRQLLSEALDARGINVGKSPTSLGIDQNGGGPGVRLRDPLP